MNVDAAVQRCLEMIAISRVFDIEGLREVLGEIGSECYRVAVSNKDKPEGDGGDRANHSSTEISTEIVDSEEDITPEYQPEAFPPPIHLPLDDDEDDGTEIIIVDNMTHIINELFARKEKTDGTLQPIHPSPPPN